MLRRKVLICSALLFLLAMTGCGTSSSSSSPIDTFLNFIPANEVGAPTPMKCLIETDAGDAGYCSSSIIPGNITYKREGSYYIIDWNINNLDYKFKMSADGSELYPESDLATWLLEEHAPQN